MENNNFSCEDCDKSYKHYKSLFRHKKKYHPAVFLKNTNFPFECATCEKKFMFKGSLDRHYQQSHGGEKKIIKFLCPLCKEKVDRSVFKLHCQDVHDITIETVELDFSSLEEFLLWKQSEEESTHTMYVQPRAEKKKQNGSMTWSYKCHRSGFHKSASTGQRNIKKQGSCRINGYCPASIKVFNSDNEYHIIFTKTHLGHEADIEHITLSSKEKKIIASKLASKISFDCILDEIRDSSINNLERLHFLSKQDLYNIERCFNLKSSTVRYENSGTSVDEWVKQMNARENPCILFYKPQGTICEDYTCLPKDDFILIIMNSGQEEILEKYGKDCICIDEIHEPKNDYHLTTLLVLDDMYQCFPCAFLFSNRNSVYILSLFFQNIKNKCGIIAPHVFMSNLSEGFFEAWKAVMNQPNKRFYCSWHVDAEWRENLKRIASQEKQIETYELLKVLLEETDIDAFKNLLDTSVKKLRNEPETMDFGIYFKDNFVKNPTRWAHCYKLNAGINTNIHIEQTHKALEYIYLMGKNIKRLDKTINAIMLFVRDKLFDRLIIINKGKLTHRLKNLQERHKKCLIMSHQIIETENGWNVQSDLARKTYLVVENKIDCKCELQCNECSACFHKYSCSCVDYNIKWNMCKHIHYVISSNALQNTSRVEDCSENLVYMDEAEEYVEIEVITTELQNSNEESSLHLNYLEERKKAVIQEFTNIMNSVSSTEELEAIEKLLQPMKPTIEAYQIIHQFFEKKE